MIAGENDPTTPPRFVARALEHLPNGRLLEVPQLGHSLGGIYEGYLDRIVHRRLPRRLPRSSSAVSEDRRAREPAASRRRTIIRRSGPSLPRSRPTTHACSPGCSVMSRTRERGIGESAPSVKDLAEQGRDGLRRYRASVGNVLPEPGRGPSPEPRRCLRDSHPGARLDPQRRRPTSLDKALMRGRCGASARVELEPRAMCGGSTGAAAGGAVVLSTPGRREAETPLAEPTVSPVRGMRSVG